MNEVYIYLSYEADPNKEHGIGFFVNSELVDTFKEIAKNNELYLLIENEFDFTKKGGGVNGSH